MQKCNCKATFHYWSVLHLCFIDVMLAWQGTHCDTYIVTPKILGLIDL